MLRTIREYVDFQAANAPDSLYLIAPEPNLRMTFGGLQKASRTLARYLVERGIEPGEKVALLMQNGYQTCRLFIGAMYGGFCVTPLICWHRHRSLNTFSTTAMPRLFL